MITNEHLQAIEHTAYEARQQILDRLAAYGCILHDNYACLFDPDITLQAAVGLITGGPVEPESNLVRRNERLAGVLEWVATTPHIYYEAYDLGVRQRFSIAHELGHFCLHAQQRRHWQCTHASVDLQESDGEVLSTSSSVEKEADAFAAAFLMPQALLSEDIVRFGRCVAFLAARYRVSDPAMRRRLRGLGMIE